MQKFEILRTHGMNCLEDTISIRQSVFVVEQGIPVNRVYDGKDFLANHYTGYNDGKPVSTARVRRVNGAGKIDLIAVVQGLRHAGLGRLMMDMIESDLVAENVLVDQVDAPLDTRDFFEKVGYNIDSDVFRNASTDRVPMHKVLPWEDLVLRY